ncbi:hypothetical protein HK100_012273 [Physocladia obscura]|uniref:Uncharacterized protein n=1 Tax=Physocladia obscura TaxID=109957 RepID=A0AAD5XHR0_9FUNG|nr:hypothetical protein HK100_012273 [Physocladia obscura]
MNSTTVVFKAQVEGNTTMRKFAWSDGDSSLSAFRSKLSGLFPDIRGNNKFRITETDGGADLSSDGDLAMLLFRATASGAASVRLTLHFLAATVPVHEDADSDGFELLSDGVHSDSDADSDFSSGIVNVHTYATPTPTVLASTVIPEATTTTAASNNTAAIAAVTVALAATTTTAASPSSVLHHNHFDDAVSAVESVEAVFDDSLSAESASPKISTISLPLSDENPFLDPVMDALIESVSNSMLLDSATTTTRAPAILVTDFVSSSSSSSYQSDLIDVDNIPDAAAASGTDDAISEYTESSLVIGASAADSPMRVEQSVQCDETFRVVQVEAATSTNCFDDISSPAEPDLKESPASTLESAAAEYTFGSATPSFDFSAAGSSTNSTGPVTNVAESFCDDIAPLLNTLLQKIEANPEVIPFLIQNLPSTLAGFNFGLTVENASGNVLGSSFSQSSQEQQPQTSTTTASENNSDKERDAAYNQAEEYAQRMRHQQAHQQAHREAHENARRLHDEARQTHQNAFQQFHANTPAITTHTLQPTFRTLTIALIIRITVLRMVQGLTHIRIVSLVTQLSMLTDITAIVATTNTMKRQKTLHLNGMTCARIVTEKRVLFTLNLINFTNSHRLKIYIKLFSAMVARSEESLATDTSVLFAQTMICVDCAWSMFKESILDMFIDQLSTAVNHSRLA